MGAFVDGVERCLPYLEPVLVLLAAGLISLDVFTFFKYVLPEVCSPTTKCRWHIMHLYRSWQHGVLAGATRGPGATTQPCPPALLRPLRTFRPHAATGLTLGSLTARVWDTRMHCTATLALLTWRHLVCSTLPFRTQPTPCHVAQIFVAGGSVVAGLHVAWSLWLLFNVFWNQMHCTFSSPGTTLEVNEQVGRAGGVGVVVGRAPGPGTCGRTPGPGKWLAA